MKSLIEKLPNWLRWLLFFPFAIIGHFIINIVIIAINEFSLPNFITDGFIYNIWLRITADGFAAAGSVWIGSTIVPKYRFRVAIALSIVLIISTFFAITHLWNLPFSERENSFFDLFVSLIVTIIGSISASFQFYNKD